MKLERDNATTNEVEYVEEIRKPDTRSRTVSFLVFLGCLAFAFIMWCYANYIDDPIIQKKVDVKFNFVGGNINESVISETATIIVYGEESALSGITELKADVYRAEFINIDDKIRVKVYLPEGVHSHDPYVFVELVVNENDQTPAE